VPRLSYAYRTDPAVPRFADERPVVVFDGKCALCSSFAQFILKKDRDWRFRLLPAQTELGTALYRHFGLDPVDYQTHVLLLDGKAYPRSDATLRILAGLGSRGGCWRRPASLFPCRCATRSMTSSRATACAGSVRARNAIGPSRRKRTAFCRDCRRRAAAGGQCAEAFDKTWITSTPATINAMPIRAKASRRWPNSAQAISVISATPAPDQTA
jgi:predicted DCC family thiol-disulfide oxidoreductase YuxK